MNKASIVTTSADACDEVPVQTADIASGKLVLRKRGEGGAILPDKQRVTISLDGSVLAYFRAKAGQRGYQTLINEALKHAIQAESIEAVVRRAIREEMGRA
jgi:uncharacterized protein (DUF4415 family)